ncbi:hypothetical protein IM793_13940 [Pedobacter sp. MR2016-19]|nr:hypothetical protein [Pedobacter sp. MR2016-19]MBE5320262.1 hypothetical protein [Pedobacter sp. MR2016-19]
MLAYSGKISVNDNQSNYILGQQVIHSLFIQILIASEETSVKNSIGR